MEAEIRFPTPQGQVPGHRAHVTRQNTAEAMCMSIHTDSAAIFLLCFTLLHLTTVLPKPEVPAAMEEGRKNGL